MADVTHYARARKLTEAVGDAENRAGLEAQLAVSTAIREIDRSIANGFRNVLETIDEQRPPVPERSHREGPRPIRWLTFDAFDARVDEVDATYLLHVNAAQIVAIEALAPGEAILLTTGGAVRPIRLDAEGITKVFEVTQ